MVHCGVIQIGGTTMARSTARFHHRSLLDDDSVDRDSVLDGPGSPANASLTPSNAPAAGGLSGQGDPPNASFASIATLADYLVDGYHEWSGYGGTGPRHWADPTNISVNIQDLTAAERTIAQQALSLWDDVCDVTFTFTAGAADIDFINDGSGEAVASYSVSGTSLSNATVHISSNWSGGAASGNFSYFFQTYVHEIGHALGLGHQGPYNGSATYGVDNIYTNDTWRWSTMSYNDQDDAAFGDTHDYVLTPQMADIYAVQSIYGAQTTRTGDTTYGFNSTAGSFYNFSTYSGAPAFTYYDTGGVDTLDASGYSNDQTINLNPGNWSSIGGEVNNIGIYLTTTIENAKGGSGDDAITGNAADNDLFGNGGADTLSGGGGDDSLDGGTGADTLNGGLGNDLYIIDNAGDVAAEVAGGTDTVRSSVTHTLSTNLENLTLTGSFNRNGTGNAKDNLIIGNTGNNVLSGLGGDDTLKGGGGADTLLGGDGDDTLEGGTGADNMDGGTGSDTYVVDNVGDVAGEVANGVDLVQASISHTLSVNLENLTLTGTSNINGTGNNSRDNVITGNSGNNSLSGLAGADTLVGGSGNDSLNGGTGADNMNGGLGNDLYIVDHAGDVAGEVAGGTDTVQSSITHTLSANLENLTLTGTANINGTGNAKDNVITGNTGNNVLSGLAGADTLSGGSGNDSLNGGTGADNMNGGFGDDTYVVDNAGDVAGEVAGGVGRVQSSVTHTLSTNLENLFLTGAANINGTGNAKDNQIIGNTGNNVLSGLGGDDTLKGAGGADTLIGGDGNDTLNGGTGADNMNGGSGNDTFVVDNVGDVAVEAVARGGGVDLVQASTSHTLSANLENLTLTGTSAINGTGNALNNVITGNTGNNSLSGLAGDDTLIGGSGNDALSGGDGNDTVNGGTGADNMNGGLGNDLYIVDNAGDVAGEVASGLDTVQSSVTHTLSTNLENLTLTGSAAINGTGNDRANAIIGNSADNILSGLAGNDTLSSGGGNDIMSGGDGNDTFLFDQPLIADNFITISDFTVGFDRIALDLTTFTAVGPVGPLAAAAFFSGAAALDADDRIGYNGATGNLLYDADGNGAGAAVAFASMTPGIGITAVDFTVIA
ncbi:hypothetical protein BH10PSE6_BH10PSE6_14240 [soil metagenome]